MSTPKRVSDALASAPKTRKKREISTGLRYTITVALFFGGFVTIAQSFNFVGFEAWVFTAGLLMITGGLAVAIHA
jgi:hypothetical protein